MSSVRADIPITFNSTFKILFNEYVKDSQPDILEGINSDENLIFFFHLFQSLSSLMVCNPC